MRIMTMGTALLLLALGGCSDSTTSGGNGSAGAGATEAGGTGGVDDGGGGGGGDVPPGELTPITGKVEKVDLLLVVDNSISMVDKQEVLALSVPALVQGLIDPACVDDADQPDPSGARTSTGCPAGYSPRFSPVVDLHVGVVSSSLGGSGGEFCNPLFATPDFGFDPTKDDRGELIGSAGEGRSVGGEPVCAGNANASCAARNAVAPLMVTDGVTNLGFLAWDPNGMTGLQNVSTTVPDLVDGTDPSNPSGKLVDLVRSAGEQGCGFEAPLESWYRFLVEPDPPVGVVFSNGSTTRLVNADGTPAVNDLVLRQRDAFLRADSAVGVVLLSDENDCSVISEGLGWYVGAGPNTLGSTHLPRSTAICATDPNNECCTTCIDQSLETRCPDQVAGCREADGVSPAFYTTLEDNQNLRCWNQKQRFGLDLLYSADRYVGAATSATVSGYLRDASGAYEVDGNGQLAVGAVANPLFAPGPDGRVRTEAYVFVQAIVGVPWQDLATPASLAASEPLRYLTRSQLDDPNWLESVGVTELTGKTIWDVALGDVETFTPPLDPHMVESVDPRRGANPLFGAVLAPPTAGALSNPVNGHERSIPTRKDLQYACIFPLLASRDCATLETTRGCDCRAVGDPPDFDKNPLCFDEGTGLYGTTQYRAKAYPGRRQLQVVKGLGAQGLPASVCPKSITPAAEDFGYRPAFDSFLDAMTPVLR